MIQKFLILLAVVILLITGCSADMQNKQSVKDGSEVTVYLSGHVQKPGTYEVQSGTDLGEVIKLAGGLLPEADTGEIDLTTPVNGTIQVYIPSVEEKAFTQRRKAAVAGVPKQQPSSAGEAPGVTQVSQPSPIRVLRSQPSASTSSQEQQMLDMINRERAGKGISPLVFDVGLLKAARLKSQDMIDNDYFSHESPKYGVPSAMLADQGILYHYFGENIAVSSSVEQAHKGLMGSPGHRQNILNPAFTQVGIGIIMGPQGLVISQEFTD